MVDTNVKELYVQCFKKTRLSDKKEMKLAAGKSNQWKRCVISCHCFGTTH